MLSWPCESGSSPKPPERFPTTEWSLVLTAGYAQTAESRKALASLCERYWYPLYAYVRRSGYDVEDAQDLVQGFFAELLDKGFLRKANEDLGRFRSFLLGSLKYHILNERRRERAQKRGGGQTAVSLDFEAAEGRYRLEPADPSTPARVFEKRWALSLLDLTLGKLREEFVQEGKPEIFDRYKAFLSFDGPPEPYLEVAAELGTSVGTVKSAIHRLRKRFADLMRAEIARTLARPEDIDDEIQHIFSVLS